MRRLLLGIGLSVVVVGVASIVPRTLGAPDAVAFNSTVAAALAVGLAAFVWVPFVAAAWVVRRLTEKHEGVVRSTPGAEDWLALHVRTPGARLRYRAVRVTRDATGLTLVAVGTPPIDVPWSSIRTVATALRKVRGWRRVLLLSGPAVRLVVIPFRDGSFASNHEVLTYAAKLLER